MRDAAGKLPDRFKLLRLPQLPLHGAQFGNILGNHFDRIGMILNRQTQHMQPHR